MRRLHDPSQVYLQFQLIVKKLTSRNFDIITLWMRLTPQNGVCYVQNT
jgi:hypothetical protein